MVVGSIDVTEHGTWPGRMASGVGAPSTVLEYSMSKSATRRSKSSATNREYKFHDTAEEPAVIPDSWARHGSKEEGDGEQFYAVEVRIGRRLEYTVDSHGEPIEGPHRDEPGIEALYVSADGGRAVVVESKAVDHDGSVTPREGWASVISRPEDDADRVTPERRDAYRALIEELYPNRSNR
jgi:hypothetical protein